VAFGDPLRAECEVRDATAGGERLGHVRGCAGVHRAPQDHERSLAEMRRDLLDRPLEYRHRWPEELVHRRADDDDDHVPSADHRRVRAQLEAAGGKNLAEEFVRTRLEERHLAAPDPFESGLVDVVDADSQARPGKREAQRQAHVAAPAKDDEIELPCRRAHGTDSSSADTADADPKVLPPGSTQLATASLNRTAAAPSS